MVALSNDGISIEGGPDVTFSLRTEGEPERQIQLIHLHAHDAAVRAMQAFREGKHPDDCRGIGSTVNWDTVLSTLPPETIDAEVDDGE